MGRRWSRKRKAADKARRAKQPNKRQRKTYTPILQGNRKMEAYYALQGLHNDYYDEDGNYRKCHSSQEQQEEQMRWMTSLRSILPASFRIGNDVDEALRERLEKDLEQYAGKEMEIVIDPREGRRGDDDMTNIQENEEHDQAAKEDTTTNNDGNQKGNDDDDSANNNNNNNNNNLDSKKMIAPARRIPFVPHAYQLSVDRRTIRRNPSLAKFHDWLKIQTSAGFVTRQETVSMIPPVVLSVEPSHAVLDMCAAPGSKTSQLLEIVSMPTDTDDLEPRGCVVANDSDPKRAYMLVHQLRRINSPCVLVTSCDAQFFPLLKSNKDKETGGEGMFDRVLCDVPCSGDGTTRKNPGIWKKWNQLGALALHPLQLGIALNGARLTKVGGFICYSTCSMNPIENEAVVAELLRSADGSLELVDKRPDMPGLLARPGWTTWRVMKEEKSRKQEKNHEKKHNKKMKDRRRQWEEKRKQEEEAEQKKQASINDDDDSEVKADEEETPMQDGDERNKEGQDDTDAVGTEKPKDDDNGREETNREDVIRKDYGPPPSWDEETLEARAKDVGFVEYKSFDEVPEQSRRRVRASCFPPTDEEVAKFGLETCLRCLPHDMDTGGFFVALLRKVAPMSTKARERALKLARELRSDVVDNDRTSCDPNNNRKEAKVEISPTDEDAEVEEAEESEPVASSNFDTTEIEDMESQEESNKEEPKPSADGEAASQKIVKGKPLLRGRGKTRGDLGNENFIPLDDDHWAPLVEFYGLSPSFPRDQYMKRACGEAKVFYFIGNAIKAKLMDRGIQERVTVINSGLKGFERNNKVCQVKYRVTQEGIHYLAPHMTKRKVIAKLDDFSRCLASGDLRLEIFSDEFAAAVREITVGSFVVALEGFERDFFKKMFLVMWRCRRDALNCLVAKVEMDGMMSKIRAVQEESEKPDADGP